MSDIVERLRADHSSNSIAITAREAADEIERLRVDKAELLEALHEIADGADAKAFVRSRARSALAKAEAGL